MSTDRPLKIWLAALLWSVVTIIAALYGIRVHYEIRVWLGLLIAIMMLVGGELFMAVPAVSAAIQKTFSPRSAVLLSLWPLAAYISYAWGTSSLTWARAGAATAFSFAPALLALSASGSKPGVWQDYLALFAMALPVKLEWLRFLFPFPKYQLAYSAGILMAINMGLVAFVLIRRIENVGYFAGWRSGWGWAFIFPLTMIAVIDIPAGIALRFIRFAPRHANVGVAIVAFLGIFVFTGVAEEFLFRGLLQNLLGSTLSNENAGWVVASIVFGFSHISNGGHYPNWKYVLLATIAGMFYGYSWRKTRSLFPGALVHACVDWLWFLLFRTL